MNTIGTVGRRPKSFDDELVATLPKLLPWLILRTSSRDAANDIVQSTSVKALAAWHQFQPGTNFRAWLFRIAFNELRDVWRSKKRAKIVPLDVEMVDAVCSVRATQDQCLDRRLLNDAFASMDPRKLEAFALTHFEGHSYEDAAAMTGVGLGTLKSRVSRAKDHVREQLGEGA